MTKDRSVAEISTCEHITFKRNKTSMPPAEFEPAVSASERRQTHALDRAPTGIAFIGGDCNGFVGKVTWRVCEGMKCNNDTSVKGKAIPLQAWTDPEGSRSLRLPNFKTVGT